MMPNEKNGKGRDETHMDLDKRNVDASNGIPDRYTGVCVGTGVDHNGNCSIRTGSMDAVYNCALVVRLERREAQTK